MRECVIALMRERLTQSNTTKFSAFLFSHTIKKQICRYEIKISTI